MFPSWGWWIVNGATTFYENWPLDAKSDISMNHIMFGEISAWYYKALGGIFPDEENPGFKNIILKPNFVKGLDQFEATHESPYGTILSSWKRKGRAVDYQVSIPANSTARLQLRGTKFEEGSNDLSKNTNLQILEQNKEQVILELKAGKYRFSVR